MSPENIAAALQKALRERNLPFESWVREVRSVDLSITLQRGERIVVRCVDRAAHSDQTTLATMVAQGDFDRAILICCDDDQPEPVDEIEICWIGDIDAMAATLALDGAAL